MVPIQCFLIEPVWKDQTVEFAKYESWIPEGKTIAHWVRVDNGEIRQHNSEFGVGAMWFAYWGFKNREWQNETGPHLYVRCPNGPADAAGRIPTRDWDVDARASNCTLPEDKLHRCWVRHGSPPAVHVDKSGHTCSAGAGSIALPGWHGFLRNGMLVE